METIFVKNRIEISFWLCYIAVEREKDAWAQNVLVQLHTEAEARETGANPVRARRCECGVSAKNATEKSGRRQMR